MSWLSTVNDVTKTGTTDGSLADTQSAVDYVAAKAQDGWVITVGASGQPYTWATALSVNIPHITTIKGASSSNRPTITSSFAGAFGLEFVLTNQKTIFVKDIIFDAWGAANALIFLSGSGSDTFAFTNIKFIGTTKMPFWISSPNAAPTGLGGPGPYGVIAACRFEAASSPTIGYVRESDQLTSWQRAHSWDSKEQVFIEDCEFVGTTFNNGSPLVDGDQGCRVHVRHNTISNGSVGMHGSEGDNTKLDAGFQLQVSDNVFTITNGEASGQTVFIRSGSARVWGNSLLHVGTGFYNVFVKTFYFRDIATDFGGNPTLADRDYIDGTGTGGDDYVGTQQPGCGYVGVAGQDPNYPTKPWGVVPIRVWSNTFDTPPTFYHGLSNAFTLLNRDFFFSHDDAAKPVGWSEYTYPHPLRGPLTAPVFTSAASIAGSPVEGQMLIADPGVVEGVPHPHDQAGQWFECSTP